ncbi:MAG TPA: D-beta-D-heptose 1-phosphate adenosyltransferase, partial [Pseudonocardia sp.]
MRGGRVVVIGDALLDVDIEGRVERTTPDAGLPVFDVTSEAARPGGAGLAAAVLAADGMAVTLVTALCADEA